MSEIKHENVNLAIRLLNHADDIVGFLAMCAAGREVPIHVRDEAIRLLELLFPHEQRPFGARTGVEGMR